MKTNGKGKRKGRWEDGVRNERKDRWENKSKRKEEIWNDGQLRRGNDRCEKILPVK